MSNFKCEHCGTAILEGLNGRYVTGCEHYPIEKMSQHERTAKHKEKHPESESRRKSLQRDRDNLMLFFIKRNKLYGYDYPAEIDQDCDAFKRVYSAYMAELDQPVVVEVN